MRKLIGQTGIGGNNESWYYIEKCPNTSEFFYIHEWNNMSYSLSIDSGERKIPLAEAKGAKFFEKAMELCEQWSSE